MLRRCKPEADNLASTIKGSGLKWKETFFNCFLVKIKLNYSSSKYFMGNSGASVSLTFNTHCVLNLQKGKLPLHQALNVH